MRRLDVAIIGGGPAGLTAATYLRRFLRDCVVVDAGGSRARHIPESHNCPGFPLGVSGEALLLRMRAQAASFGAEVVRARVDRIERVEDGFEIRAGARAWRARRAIVATGLVDRLPQVPWAEAAIACGALRLCAVCDAYEVRDRRIGVYGPGAVVGAHGRFLRAYSARVWMLPTDDDLDHAAIREARGLGVGLLPAGGELVFDGARCGYRTPDGATVGFDTVYPQLGYEGRHALLRGLAPGAEEDGEVEVDAHQQTRVPGLYAIGDVVGGLNQISVAVGQAAVAATHAHNALPLAPRG